MNRARGFGALSVALGLMFVGCGGDDGGGGGEDDGGEAGSAGSSSRKGGGSGKGGSGGKGGKGGSAGSAGSNAGNGGTSGSGGSAGAASAGEAGSSVVQGGTNGEAGEGGVGGSAQAGASSGGHDSGGDGGGDEGGASGEAAGGQATGGNGQGAGGAGGESIAGGAGGSDEAGGAGGNEAAGAGGQSEAGGAGGSANAPVIVVFDGGTRNTGATWSGRTGLDNVCQSAKTAQSIAGGAPHALISVTSVDEIADFPTLYGLPTNRAFASVSGAVIADDFADLLDGSLDLSIEAAGILLSEPGLWFTGSNADGTASTNTCQGWTTTVHSNEIRANYGYTGNTDSWWLDGSATATCAAVQYHILCVTWE